MQCQTPINIPHPTAHNSAVRLVVPCSKCSICLTNRREEWTIRLQEEMKSHYKAIFLTLTYSDENIYRNDYNQGSVNKRDVQLFFKKLRKKLSVKIRYYLVAEYGEKTYRPHYHAIIFGISNKSTEKIQEAWKYGHIMVGSVGIASIKYVAKYHLNKNLYPDGCDPPFVLMSRRPAIGYDYIDKMKKFHNGNIDRSFYQEYQQKKNLPRYYKEKLYSKIERQAIAAKYQPEGYSIEEIKKHENLYKTTIYRRDADNLRNRERLFKIKKNIQNKI